MDTKVTINVRIPISEMEILNAYCKQAGRSKTDVIRGFIQELGEELAEFERKRKILEEVRNELHRSNSAGASE